MTYTKRRGRPRKVQTEEPKRPRGRPRKVLTEEQTSGTARETGPDRPIVPEGEMTVVPENSGDDPSRCICGRNLNYPLEVTDTVIICRCGRCHPPSVLTFR